MNKKIFSYPPYFKTSNLFLSGIIIFLASVFGLAVFLQTKSFIAISAIVLFILANLALWLNDHPDFAIQDDGIVLKVYRFWSKTILWSDIIEVKDFWLPITGKQISVVVVRHLTPAHFVIGMLYGLTLQPAFVITWALEEREEAIGFIRSQIAGKTSKAKSKAK